jgi:D-aminoacyl-tRNA deacylase
MLILLGVRSPTHSVRQTRVMRGLVQRVSQASVSVAGENGPEVVGEIGAGLCVLVGVTHNDTEASARKLADKIWGLRVIDDDNGVMNRSVADIGGEVLIVSQFTLYGDTSGGRRPSWINAARPEHAEPLVQAVIDQLRAAGANVATGRFRTEMQVSLVNDGPVTVLLEV